MFIRRLLPLHYGDRGEHTGIYTDNADYPQISMAQNVHVATVHHLPELAEYLVKAANSHPELIATLRRLETAIIMDAPPLATKFCDELLAIIHEAIDNYA